MILRLLQKLFLFFKECIRPIEPVGRVGALQPVAAPSEVATGEIENRHLRVDNLKLSQENERLRKKISLMERQIGELESAAKAPLSPSPEDLLRERHDESEREKRLVNRVLDLVTVLDVFTLGKDVRYPDLIVNLRNQIGEALSGYGISLYREETVPFNPRWHQLISLEHTDDPALDNVVRQALSTGVRIKEDRCLRPEKVTVYKLN